MTTLYPILYVDLLRQAGYKNAVLLGMIHKQMVYFGKKYSKSNRITLDKYSTNKLSALCKKDNIKIVRYVSKKVNLIWRDRLMYYCVRVENIKIVRYLLNCEYDINKITDVAFEKTLLSYGCCHEKIKIIKLLLEKGASVYVYHCSALLRGSESNNTAVMKTLLKSGFDIHLGDDLVLQWSALFGKIEVIKLLLNKGANVHANNDKALRLGAKHRYTEIVKLLLDKGANVDVIANKRVSREIRNIINVHKKINNMNKKIKKLKLKI